MYRSRVKNNRDKKRKKLVLQTIMLIVLVSITFSFVFGGTNESYETKTITVRNNDTLWSIGNKICKTNDDLYILNVINDIKKLNDMKNSNIFVEQELLVYIYE